MNKERRRVLKVMADGGRIEARRVFPRPHNFWLVNVSGHREARSLGADVVSDLVNCGYIVPVRCDQDWDAIDYDIAEDDGRSAITAKSIEQWEQTVIPGTENL